MAFLFENANIFTQIGFKLFRLIRSETNVNSTKLSHLSHSRIRDCAIIIRRGGGGGEMLSKLSNLNSHLALTQGYLNPALNNSALDFKNLLG